MHAKTRMQGRTSHGERINFIHTEAPARVASGTAIREGGQGHEGSRTGSSTVDRHGRSMRSYVAALFHLAVGHRHRVDA